MTSSRPQARTLRNESAGSLRFLAPDASADPMAPILNHPAGAPLVIGQLGQSLDGRIATRTGESRWINRTAALEHLHRLRDAVDAVVVGVGTVVADDPQLNVRRVPRDPARPQPARVVIDPTGRSPSDANLFRVSDGARCLVIRNAKSSEGSEFDGKVSATQAEEKDDIEQVFITSNHGARLCPRMIVSELRSRGLNRLLIEGGAATLSAFIDAGVINRLHVLVSPVIIGSGRSGLTLAPIARLADAKRPHTRVHVLDDGDVLFDCDLSGPETIPPR